MSNPFFSIIIPCYNCAKTIERCLGSIISNRNNYDLSKVQVILIDDGNDDNWTSLINYFKSKLNIEYYQQNTYDIHCPSNTRREGLKYVKGQWILFMDCDDMLADNTLAILDYNINVKNAKYVICGNVVELNYEKHEGTRSSKTTTLLHGKCYKKEFLDKYNINFKENLLTHEDLYFNTAVLSVLIKLKENDFFHIDDDLYYWIWNPKSITRIYYQNPQEKNYLEAHFDDYLYAYTDNYIKMWNQGIKKDQIYFSILSSIWYGYLYYQGELYNLGEEKSQSEKEILINHINHIIKECSFIKQEILDFVYGGPWKQLCWEIREEVPFTSGFFIEIQSFKDFINENIK